MANQAAASSTLVDIKTKVRRITRSLSEAQLSDAQLSQYINTYVLYDFPETLRLFNLKTTFSFYTSPFVDTYTTTDNTNSPLYNFTNRYITTDQPVYIAGFPALYTESREKFYSIYPIVNSIASLGTYGNGTTAAFSGVINSQQNSPFAQNQVISLLQNNVLFSAIDSNGNGLAMQDIPILDASTGLPTIYGSLYNALTTSVASPLFLNAPYDNQAAFPTSNYINYVTGQYTVTFQAPPASGSQINSQTVPTNPSLPQSILFFDGYFVVRPVPDQSYRVDMEVFAQPTALLSGTSTPDLNEWWQLIAWNAAKKVFEERMDYDSINMIMPSLKEQEVLVLRRTIKQQTSQRVSTIYSDQSNAGTYGSGFYNGGGNF